MFDEEELELVLVELVVVVVDLVVEEVVVVVDLLVLEVVVVDLVELELELELEPPVLPRQVLLADPA